MTKEFTTPFLQGLVEPAMFSEAKVEMMKWLNKVRSFLGVTE